ncbi:hypothetical protein MLD38_030315 [Melastoma candidum]|uniref:Uncharacterized protein n=1 Tax=Melastoma candidum TaxID=119954 RepID=A0ACB9MKV9_9MYRT|nr:hypothetical protein MLD38_030315 [Melastoma candidum]
MVRRTFGCPTIAFRPLQPSDLEILERIHGEVFPIRYEHEFFQNVVHRRDILSWAAVDQSRSDGKCNELIGFVTARIVPARESEILDLLSYGSLRMDQSLIYILTLGVVESYRNLGVASSLIRQVVIYALTMPTCIAVYLHVISYNIPAICLYEKMSFKCLRKLRGFYLINGQHYDSYLFVHFVNGIRSPCSLLELVKAAASHVRRGFNLLISVMWNNDEEVARWSRCKESSPGLARFNQNKKIRTAEATAYERV